MNSTETSSDPWSSSTEYNDELQAGIDDLNSRNAEEVSLADIAGVVANLNEKICLLRKEILELRDCGTVSGVRKSAEIESGNPSGSPSEDQRTVRNLALNFIRKIMPLAFFERTILRRNESKESISGSKFSISSDLYGCTPSDGDLPFKSETQSGRRLVYVVGAQAKSRSASPFKPEKDSKIRKKLPGKGSTDTVTGDAEIIGRGEMKRLNEPTKINKGRKNNAVRQKVQSNGGEVGDDDDDDNEGDNVTINTSENCLSDKVACVKRKRDGRRTGKWKKSAPGEPTKLNKCLNTKCYGKRVRKRISRGVQTVPKKRSRIVNLLRKFKWRSRKKRRKEKVSMAGETPSKKGSADMIFEPGETSARSREDNTGYNIESNDVTSETTNDERKMGRKQRSDDSQARNRNRKYELSIDGKKVETIRTEKNNPVIKRENPKLLGNTTETKKRSGLREKGTKADRNRGAKIQRKEGNLSSSDVGTSDRISEPRTDKSKPRESITQRINPADKTDASEGNKLRQMNNEDKGARSRKKQIDNRDTGVAEKPAAKTRTKRSRHRKNPSTFKAFTDSVRNSFTQQQRPSHPDDRNQEIGNEPIADRLDARKNDIADVKRRLDICIDDLNDIILTLSKLFREAPASGGPAGEGTQSQNQNTRRRG